MTRMPDAVEVDVGAGSGVEGARRATGGPDPATTLPGRAPDPEVPRPLGGTCSSVTSLPASTAVLSKAVKQIGQRSLPKRRSGVCDLDAKCGSMVTSPQNLSAVTQAAVRVKRPRGRPRGRALRTGSQP